MRLTSSALRRASSATIWALTACITHEHQLDGRSFISRGVPLRNPQSDISAVLVVSYDITERRRAEEALHESEGRFRTLADTVPQLIWTNDTDGQAIYFNQR